MTVHQCPKCELRFQYKTMLDDHCWHDHPQFRHEYPATRLPPQPDPIEPPGEVAPAAHEHVGLGESLMRWVVPRHRHD